MSGVKNHTARQSTLLQKIIKSLNISNEEMNNHIESVELVQLKTTNQNQSPLETLKIIY